MTQPSGASEPRRIARPASADIGFDRGRMTSSSKTSAPSSVCDTVNPETVMTSCRSSRDIRPRRPPASKKSCIRYLPDGPDVGEHRHGPGELVEAVHRQRNPGPARHRDQVDDRVGGAAQAPARPRSRSRTTPETTATRAARRSAGPRRPPSAGGPNRRPESTRHPASSRPAPRPRTSSSTRCPSSCSARGTTRSAPRPPPSRPR